VPNLLIEPPYRTYVLTLRDVRKTFGKTVAVDGLSLSVRKGEILGLLGPNGAGKSTSVSLSVGLLAPDAGSVVIDGNLDPAKPEVRHKIGVAPQALALYDALSGEENLRFFGEMYGLSGGVLDQRVTWCLEFVGLTDRKDDLAGGYSGGMKRRLNLAAALIHDPELLLLDEPTVGVDPQSRNKIFESIEELHRQGRTIIYTTHYMEEAERLCDRIAIIDAGRLLALGTLNELLAAHGGPPMLMVKTNGEERRTQTADPLGELNRVAATATIEAFQMEKPTLEQVFLRLTGRSLRD
jgi:ABC-2 type transport system ATP-binding protein